MQKIGDRIGAYIWLSYVLGCHSMKIKVLYMLLKGWIEFNVAVNYDSPVTSLTKFCVWYAVYSVFPCLLTVSTVLLYTIYSKDKFKNEFS